MLSSASIPKIDIAAASTWASTTVKKIPHRHPSHL